ncbi:MAG TPA: 16S rRNA (adenine(1518)-N(6)/adenine(1519)-N(6))-dimethyltransferase RsmA [Candidatus Saccharimonadales bacterium]|nr:16S rRNA (adenine(1518)-N(6)/adenine(1519)-N(6))-dimethyltransferase RsmA [Candidatus Saccharimonadales bacterium]
MATGSRAPGSQAPKKSLGQHWLRDGAALQAMCDAADLRPDDFVLEIGPGLGTLTELLVKRADNVVAVEFDGKLADELPSRVAADNLGVVHQDILSFDLTRLPPDYKLIANIPYYLTSNLIRAISETSNPPLMAAILVQKEVAERVAAKPGAMSLLSVTAQFYWEVSLGREVPAELFEPPPKVDSQILVMNRRPQPLFNVDTKAFFRLAKAGFAQRRKTLLNSLAAGLHLDRTEVQKWLESVGIDPKRRAQTLSLDEWHALYSSMNT